MTKASSESRARASERDVVERGVLADMKNLDIADLKSMRTFMAKIAAEPEQAVFTAYLPPRSGVMAKVTAKTADGTTVVGDARRAAGGIVVIDTKPPTHRSHRDLMMVARDRYDSLRAEIVNKSLSLTQAAKKMRLSPEGLSARVDRREMLAFPDKNRKMIPIELIDTEQANATIPGLPEVLQSASMEPFRLAVWLLSESRALGGKKPVDVLRQGNVARVVTAVKGVGAS
jgi:hypothetical protein